MTQAISASQTAFDKVVSGLSRHLNAEKVIETNAAIVLLTASRAYKIKKPKKTKHFDHRTSEGRHRTCMAEIDVNTVLAPDVYLGLSRVTLSSVGTVKIDGEGETIDWAIVMRRLPSEHLLDDVIRSGRPVDWAAFHEVMARLEVHYRSAPVKEERHGLYIETLRHEARLNVEHLYRWTSLLGTDVLRYCESAIEGIEANSEELQAREAKGLVIDGHGDLRPEHICLKPPVIFDRLEFSETYRIMDVFDELEYLAVESELLGSLEIGARAKALAMDAGFLPPSPSLARTFRILRSLIRARLTIDHLLDPVPRTPDVWPAKARRYLALVRASR